MSVVVESFSTAGFTVNAGPYTISAPSGVVDGDLLLWFVEFEDETSTPLAGPTIVTPAGWTKAGGSDNFAANHSWAAFYRIASGEPASYTVTIAAPENNDCGMIMLRLSGHHATLFHDAFLNTDNSLVCPSVSTTLDNCAIFRMAGHGQATAPTCPGGTSSVAFRDQSFGGSLRVCRGADQTPAGATGTATFTGAAGAQHALTWAIAPAPPSGHGGGAGSSPAVLAQGGAQRIRKAIFLRDFWEEIRR